ncbi:MAG: hypothetical protein IT371_00225 [Deltaproteobacteria bacterium]|nr:hypothetical protein [Deltaproteobacteria bacterium]
MQLTPSHALTLLTCGLSNLLRRRGRSRLGSAVWFLGAGALAASAPSTPLYAATPAPRAAEKGRSDGFRWGVSADWGIFAATTRFAPGQQEAMIRRLKQLGVDHVRYELPMRETLDIARNPQHPALRAVRAFRRAGLDVIAVVGVGSSSALPKGLDAGAPDYIDRVAANVRDIARALRPLGVRHFQVENELNSAGLTTLPGWGWRSGHTWWSWDFKEKLMRSLSHAVREQVPGAVLTTNFYDQFSDPVPLPADKRARAEAHLLTKLVRRSKRLTEQLFWLPATLLLREDNMADAIYRLSRFVDRVGVDYYPNYVLPIAVTNAIGIPAGLAPLGGALGTGDPGGLLKRRVAFYRRVSGKPVTVAETGYESRSPLGHGRAGQAEFVDRVARAARASGAVGMTYFRLADPTHHARAPLLTVNRWIEPYFGLLDQALQPKSTKTLRWTTRQVRGLTVPWPAEERVSAFAAYAKVIREDRGTRSRTPATSPATTAGRRPTATPVATR